MTDSTNLKRPYVLKSYSTLGTYSANNQSMKLSRMEMQKTNTRRRLLENATVVMMIKLYSNIRKAMRWLIVVGNVLESVNIITRR